jgi:hypothetical protein
MKVKREQVESRYAGLNEKEAAVRDEIAWADATAV